MKKIVFVFGDMTGIKIEIHNFQKVHVRSMEYKAGVYGDDTEKNREGVKLLQKREGEGHDFFGVYTLENTRDILAVVKQKAAEEKISK